MAVAMSVTPGGSCFSGAQNAGTHYYLKTMKNDSEDQFG
jgi:hypothetical protein